MPEDLKFHIRPVLDGQTLAASLRKLRPELSWTQVKKLISGRHIHVNGNLCVEEDRRLRTDDVVHVFAEAKGAPARPQDLRIIYMDAHLVIVDKPAGVTTMREKEAPSKSHRHDRMPTLDQLVQRAVNKRMQDLIVEAKRKAGIPSRKKLGRALKMKPNRPMHQGSQPAMKVPRVRAVHRLDRDTSGLMIFALSPAAEQSLLRMFKTHAIDRRYLAIVHGHPVAQKIESWFVRDRGDGLRGSVDSPAEGSDAKKAITHIKPVQTLGEYSVVECKLETGRTHQIRIHLQQIGHMLCGESTYTHRLGEQPAKDASAPPRQALHSADIAFTHPVTAQAMQFTSPIPNDLDRWLARLGKKLHPIDTSSRSAKPARTVKGPQKPGGRSTPFDQMRRPRRG